MHIWQYVTYVVLVIEKLVYCAKNSIKIPTTEKTDLIKHNLIIYLVIQIVIWNILQAWKCNLLLVIILCNYDKITLFLIIHIHGFIKLRQIKKEFFKHYNLSITLQQWQQWMLYTSTDIRCRCFINWKLCNSVGCYMQVTDTAPLFMFQNIPNKNNR